MIPRQPERTSSPAGRAYYPFQGEKFMKTESFMPLMSHKIFWGFRSPKGNWGRRLGYRKLAKEVSMPCQSWRCRTHARNVFLKSCTWNQSESGTFDSGVKLSKFLIGWLRSDTSPNSKGYKKLLLLTSWPLWTLSVANIPTFSKYKIVLLLKSYIWYLSLFFIACNIIATNELHMKLQALYYL